MVIEVLKNQDNEARGRRDFSGKILYGKAGILPNGQMRFKRNEIETLPTCILSDEFKMSAYIRNSRSNTKKYKRLSKRLKILYSLV